MKKTKKILLGILTTAFAVSLSLGFSACGDKGNKDNVHSFGDWTAFTSDDTPCENRLFFRVCSTCKNVEWKQGTADDHDWEVVTTPPTCQAQGYNTNTCSICGKVEIDTYTAIADHAWDTQYSFDNSYHWIECDTCDDSKGHEKHTVEASGECSVCHELVGATEGVLYEVVNGKARVVGYEGTAKKVRIAETYESAPVTEIGDNAFVNTSITAVIIPDCVTSIGEYTFYSCSSLTSVDIGDGVTTIGYNAFNGCRSLTSIVIPDSVTSIGNNAFNYCSSLTSIVIPDSVTTIGGGAFSTCYSLTSVEIGDGVTTISDMAFRGCSSLTSVVIPDSVTTIGNEAFSYCSSLTSVVIGDSVTTIEERAFYECSKLQFNEYGNAKYLGSETNDYYALIEVKNKNYSSYTIHDNTKILANYAFSYCYNLTSIVIPDSVTTIGNYAFSYCSSLTSVVIGDSVTTIGNYAFSVCSSLTSVVICDGVTTIGHGAFYACSSLTSVVIGDGVTTIGSCVFDSCSSLTSVTFEDASTWYYTSDYDDWQNQTGGTEKDVSNPSNNASYFTNYYSYYWYKK